MGKKNIEKHHISTMAYVRYVNRRTSQEIAPNQISWPTAIQLSTPSRGYQSQPATMLAAKLLLREVPPQGCSTQNGQRSTPWNHAIPSWLVGMVFDIPQMIRSFRMGVLILKTIAIPTEPFRVTRKVPKTSNSVHGKNMAVCQNPGTPGEPQNSWDLWMFIPLKMVLIGIDPWPYGFFLENNHFS